MKNGFRLVIYMGVVIGVAALLFSTLKGRARGVASPLVATGFMKSKASPSQPVASLPSSSSLPVAYDESSLSAEVKKQLRILDEVFQSHNDNDPRIDGDLKVLKPEAREIFRIKYRQLPPEKRNERGTLVFLLGRNLESPSDFLFIREVLTEEPCLSLSDCSKSADRPDTQGASDAEHEHREAATATTLNYPSLMALKSLERELKAEPRPSAERREQIRQVLDSAMNSKSPQTVQMARDLQPLTTSEN